MQSRARGPQLAHSNKEGRSIYIASTHIVNTIAWIHWELSTSIEYLSINLLNMPAQMSWFVKENLVILALRKRPTVSTVEMTIYGHFNYNVPFWGKSLRLVNDTLFLFTFDEMPWDFTILLQMKFWRNTPGLLQIGRKVLKIFLWRRFGSFLLRGKARKVAA